MSPRRIQGALLLGMAALLVAIALSLRRGPSAAPGAGSDSGAVRTPQTSGLVYRSYKEGRERWLLEAKGLRGKEGEAVRLEGVRFSQPYLAQGEPGRVTIESERCTYTEAQEKAVFQGKVRITTDDGFEMETESLTYRGDRSLARTDEPTRYRRKDVSGTSTGMDYDAEKGRIVLPQDVVFFVRDPDNPPAEIHSRKAVADRAKGTLRFVEDVQAEQGPDQLKARQLTLSLDPETHAVKRALAVGNVELQTSAQSAVLGAAASLGPRKGSRVLRAQRLDLRYRPDRTLERARAVGNAELTSTSAPGERKERRQLKGQHLLFSFDAAGRAERSAGRKATRFEVEPLVKGAFPAQIVTADSFKAKLIPETGEAQTILFKGRVSFERASQKATAERARFVGKGKKLQLSDGPKLAQEGSELTAFGITLGVESGDVEARRDVRHVLRRASGAGRPGLLGAGSAATLVTSQEMSYVASRKTATYKSEALLRSGKDEVRAPLIAIEEDAKGARKLKASAGVVSIFHPRSTAELKSEAAALEGRAQDLSYDESAGRLIYAGEVTLRQGDLSTRSPSATITLSAQGDSIEKLVAGEPAEVQQGSRRANGRQVVYTPESGTMVLTGDAVQLVDGERTTRGRALTFHVGDSTILVDGREEGRTETILKKEPSPP